ncbi:protein-export chaperone SecB [Glaciimonas soli]|uniref:Preprotein translocase subunit SecB n=1 Tax=Glaciimonas soli TaxID=2590999 RepID=A0A843YWH9_9BURK|nr:protein-export chaperone SecB [Glaciimonas soli]MQR01651.1 hypothetical protein [Glaciimonas soli]
MLQIKPVKFRLKALEIADASDVDLELGDKKLSLSVEALRITDNLVEIALHLRLLHDEGMGMKVNYAVEFEVKNEKVAEFIVTDETLQDTFMQVNAPAIAYPFLRAFVATVCTNSGLNPLMLPPVNFQAMFNARQKNGPVPAQKSAIIEVN